MEHITSDGIAHALDMYTVEKRRFLETLLRTGSLKSRAGWTTSVNDGPAPTPGTPPNAVEAALKARRARSRAALT